MEVGIISSRSYLSIAGHLVKQKNKNHETVPSRFWFLEQETKRSFVLRHLCPVHEVLTWEWL